MMQKLSFASASLFQIATLIASCARSQLSRDRRHASATSPRAQIILPFAVAIVDEDISQTLRRLTADTGYHR